MTSDPEKMQPAPPPAPTAGSGARGHGSNDIRFSPWNFLLLLPLLMLVTPWYNFDSPRLFGMPFFYWFQFVFVFVGVACVWIVYLTTKNVGRTRAAALETERDVTLEKRGDVR